MRDAPRRPVAWRVSLAVVIVVNTVVLWSDAVAAWWADRMGDDDGDPILPSPVREVFSRRPDVGDADLHALAWAVAGFVAVMAAGRWRWVPWLVAAVWLWSTIVEVLQPVVSDTRQAEWIDVAGNSVGIALGAGAALWWNRRWPGRQADRERVSDRSARGGYTRGSRTPAPSGRRSRRRRS